MTETKDLPLAHQIIGFGGVYRPPPAHDKEVTIVLEYNSAVRSYKVKSLVNTIYYKPGEWMTEEVAGEICRLKNWKVEINEDDWMSKLLEHVGNFIHFP